MSLRKEMLFAISLGLMLGGAAAFAMVQLPGSSQDVSKVDPSPALSGSVTEPSPSQFVTKSVTLDILLPENQSFVQENTVTVSGKTLPGAQVVVSSPIDDTVVRAEPDGTFSQQVKLLEGTNELVILATDGTTEIEKRIVVNYTAEQF